MSLATFFFWWLEEPRPTGELSCWFRCEVDWHVLGGGVDDIYPVLRHTPGMIDEIVRNDAVTPNMKRICLPWLAGVALMIAGTTTTLGVLL